MSQPDPGEVLTRIYQVLQERKGADPDDSYVANLYKQGRDRILQKVGEEAVEVVLAAKNENPQAIIHETADLWFHTLVMLAEQDLPPERVLAELVRRFGA